MSKQEEFDLCVVNNDIEKFTLLIKDKNVDPCFNNNKVMKIAAKFNYIEFVKILLKDPRVDPSENSNFAIKFARNPEIVKLLLKDPRVDPSEIIFSFSNSGDFEIVELLLNDSRVDPTLNNNLSIGARKSTPSIAA